MNSKVLIVFLIGCFAGALCQNLCIDSCPQNEVFSECKSAGTCQLTCSTRNTTIIGDCGCVSGCICKTGYIRDANTYKCIKKSTCPPIPKVNSTTCAKNEVYSESLAGCQKSCDTKNKLYSSVKCAPKAGCICKTGYIRNPINNQCILISACDKCPSGYIRDPETKRCKLSCDICKDPNAEFNACGDRCRELTCENPLLEGIVCPEGIQCEPGCFCKAGYVKDPKTKLCIRPKSCPNPCKDPNTVYSNCGTNNTCDMQTCRFPYGQGRECLKTCAKGCFCKPGYVKNDSGKCVLLKNCPIKPCLKNEIYDCRNPSCEPGCIIEPCKAVNCENKCYCKDGYVKENGTCILLSKCKKCDDPNSTYNNCKEECSDETCLKPNGTPELCKGNCRPGCFCNKGYVLDHTRKCILLDQCPSCPENESFTCGNAACEKNCGNLNETCKIINIKCDNKCFCNEGFVRETPHGPCIPILKCPPNDCKINEVLECRNPTCDDEGCCIEKGRPCKDVPCVNKCYCADGYVRIDGVCVTRDNCFINQCPVNEIYACRLTEPTCFRNCGSFPDGPCKYNCYCADGYKRINGICIPQEQCPDDPMNCNADETFECRVPVCTSLDCFMTEPPPKGSTVPTVPPCKYKCYCAAGLENIGGQCVPITCKAQHAEYKFCFNPCSELSCENPTAGFDFNCRPDCVDGCFCKDGYYKRDDGECVVLQHCNSCPETCSANSTCSCEYPDCRPSCIPREYPCDPETYYCVNECWCDYGFHRDANGDCVTPCPPYRDGDYEVMRANNMTKIQPIDQ